MSLDPTPRTSSSTRSRGQVIPKGDRKWLVRFYSGRDPRTGKRRYSAVTVLGTRAQAQRELTRRLADVDSGRFREPPKQTLGEYLTETWLAEKAADYRAGSLAGRTLVDYRAGVKKIVGLFGAVPLASFGKPQVSELRLLLLERYTPSAAQRALDILCTAMGRAYALDLLAANPALGVKRVYTTRPNTGVLDVGQVRQFLAEAERYRDGRYSALLHVLLLGGLRPGEAVALRWDDLQENTLRVARALTKDDRGTWVIGPTKTKETRFVLLPASAVGALEIHRRRQNETAEEGTVATRDRLIFPNIYGGQMMLDRARDAWKAILKRAGLPPLRLYDARHTYVTALLHHGVDARTVADLAGHRDPAMTLRRYAHALPSSKQGAAERLQAALGTAVPQLRLA
jgi:integrase